MNLLHRLQGHFRSVLTEWAADPTPYLSMIKPVQDSRHGDYQANFAMALAKALGRKPQDLAKDISQRLPPDGSIERFEVAGPGFVNFHFRASWLAEQVRLLAADSRLGVSVAARPHTYVIDYSSPNVAKPLHVGHLRSTIIGDALARILRFLGHRVIADNHVGDWGTQFGILLYGYKHFRDDAALKVDPIREMARIYLHVRGLMKSDEDDATDDPIAEAARQETAKLHAGDPENVKLWKMFMPWCMEEIDQIYRRLDVHFDHTHGESFYNPMLPDVVTDLLKRGIAEESQGAVAIFFGENEPPALIRKKDGAFTYTTSDLATIKYRVKEWNPHAMLYVVDARQALHFKNLFAAARRSGYTEAVLEHVSFGSVLGDNRRPLKTREGGTIELNSLLDEAVERGGAAYESSFRERRAAGKDVPDVGADERRRIAEVVGIGVVKYADLSQNRTSDYVFSWEKMLATDGNTATYMQYAYARNRSIFREGGENPERYRANPPSVTLDQPAERALGLQLLRFPEAVDAAAQDYRPNAITAYLWDLSKAFSGFYQTCPVLKAESPPLRESRLLLCDLTARVIQKGLDLLGIKTVERM